MGDLNAPELAATVIVPTTGNRVAVLRHSIPSILAQSEENIEVKVIGDGAAPETRQLMAEFSNSDPRIEFIDKPKHQRRGEPYRHNVLQRAKGRIVCYLCDRDIMLPNHVERMGRLLKHHDFAHSARIKIDSDDSVQALRALDLSAWADRKEMKDACIAGPGIPLSFGAHTLDAYHRLADGWSRTPVGLFTDTYMWWKFLRHRDVSAVSDNSTVTILYFPRYPKKLWPTARRAGEMARWIERSKNQGWLKEFDDALKEARLERQLRLMTPADPSWRDRVRHWVRLRRRLLTKVVAHHVRAYRGEL